MGPQLWTEMRKQAQRSASEIVTSYVHALKLNEHPFRVIRRPGSFRRKRLSFDRFVREAHGHRNRASV